MLLIDWITLAALVVVVAAWWNRTESWAGRLIIPVSVLALLAAVIGVLDHRWQLTPAGGLACILLVTGLISRFRARPVARRPLISGSIFALLLLVSFALPYLHPANDLPEPSGPHPVGVRDFKLTDQSRTGLLAASENEPRSLLVRAWYPAESVNGHRARSYFSDVEADTTATGLGTLVGLPFYFTYVKHVQTNSYEKAPLLADAEALPVVIYSHGYTSFAGQNTALMEELASNGYIVYSIQHTYDASPTVFPDGKVAVMDPALLAAIQSQTEEGETEELVGGFIASTYDERYEKQQANRRKAVEEGQRIPSVSAEIWLADRIFVHDSLLSGDVPEAMADIAAAGNLEETGQMGMSFGGSTSGGICMIDRRCAAGVNLDGGDYHYQPFNANMPVPFLMFYSDYALLYEQMGGDPETEFHGFNDFSYERHELAGLRDDVVRLTVHEVAHLGVSDFTLFMRNPVRGLLLGTIDSDTMIQVQNDFVRGFFDTHLKGEDVGFPAVQFATHESVVAEDPAGGVRDWWLESHPEDRTIGVILETSLGDVEVVLYPERAPISVANFLAYVDGGHYDGATIYRALENSGPYGYGVIQGGLLAQTMSGDGSEYAAPERILPPIEHEPTTRTGILNERGTLAYARLAPGSAGSEFFFNLTDNPVLDTGAEVPGRDGQGYTTFGRVLRGMRVLEQIQMLPTGGATGMSRLAGQIITEPVVIRRTYRVEPAG